MTNASVPIAGARERGSAGPVALSVADRLLPLVLIASIGIGLGLAEVAPSFARELGVVVDLGVFTLISLVMLGIELGGLSAAFVQRRFLAFAVGLNFVVNPLLAFGLGRLLLSDQPDLRVGLLLFLVTPCVGWYLIFTELAGGDVELGVGLLGINVALQVLLLPLYLLAFEGASSGVEVGSLVRSVLVFLVAPAVLAWLARSLLRGLEVAVDSVTDVVDRLQIKTGVLAMIIVAMFASQSETIFEHRGVLSDLVVPMVAFFGLAFGLALAVSRFGGLSHRQTALLAFTATSRNSEASLAVAATAFSSPLVALTVVVGPVIELPLLVVMVRVLRRRSASRFG